MKKIILLLIGLTVISCGGNDDDNNLSVGIDPIIGTWKASVDQSADFAALGFTDSVIFRVILTFNSNGTGVSTTEVETDNSQILALFEDEVGNSTYTWVNVNGNPDFSNTRQFYSITEDGDDEEPDVSEVNFTSSFTELTIAESDEGFVFIKQ